MENNTQKTVMMNYGSAPSHFQHPHLNQPLFTAEEILNQVQDDLIVKTTRGFTLIELLVVVLIIGILAAVAVPQYQLAVDKSRYIQLITMITSIKKAQEIHYLATGEYTNRFNQLDIDLPPGATVKIINNVQKEQLRYSNNMAYDINFSKTTGYDDNTGMRLIYNYDHASEYSEGSANELLCYGVPNDTRRQRVCKSFGGTPIEEGSRFFRLPN